MVASGGHSPIVMPTKAITRVRCGPSNRSCTIARPTTMPAALPAPCTTRASVKASRSLANAAATEPTKASASPNSSTFLRPTRSDTGP